MPKSAEITVRPDAKGRISLGARAKGISSYRIHEQADGRLILEPFTEIPARERWVYENPEILASLERGLKDAAEGRTTYLGSFAQYADEE